jgi:hypothetical protein
LLATLAATAAAVPATSKRFNEVRPTWRGTQEGAPSLV